jgi:uncharacterized DUF497 family protein
MFKFFISIFSATVFILTLYGIKKGVSSPYFLIREVEIHLPKSDVPITSDQIHSLVGIEAGEMNLFEVTLADVEKRILENTWVGEVRLKKKLPHTLEVDVSFREPVAFLLEESGELFYIDSEGRAFAPSHLHYRANLPIISGMNERNPEAIQVSLDFMNFWERLGMTEIADLSSLSWSKEKLEVLIVFADRSKEKRRAILAVEHRFVNDLAVYLKRTREVIHYLSHRSIAAKEIRITGNKKIVVNTAGRS